MAAYGFTPTGGAIFGIVIAIVLALTIVCTIGWCLRQRYHRHKAAQEASQANEVELAVSNYNARRDARGAPVRPMPASSIPVATLPDPRHHAGQPSQRAGGYGGFVRQPAYGGGSSSRQEPHASTRKGNEVRGQHVELSRRPHVERRDGHGERQQHNQGESSRRPRERDDQRQQQNRKLSHHRGQAVRQHERQGESSRRPREQRNEQRREEGQSEQPNRQNRSLAGLVRYDVPIVTLTPSTREGESEGQHDEEQRRKKDRKGKGRDDGL